MRRISVLLTQVFLVVAMTALFATRNSLAQSNLGSVRGMIADQQGGALVGATVTLTDQATKSVRTTETNKDGEYVFSAVAPGTYTVSVSLNGFSKADRSNLRLDAGNTLTTDVAMRIGNVSDVVDVSAADPQVDSGTSYNGQLIDSQKLQNLPNPGRNPFMFAKLDNAVTTSGDPRFVRFQDQSGSSTISIAGAPMSSNNYSIDGVPITDFSNRAVIIPSIEAVEEMKLQANTYDAEIGRTSGGMFNTTLRNGGTRLHGVLQGETRQTNWGANTFFNNRNSCNIQNVAYTQCPRGAAEFYSYVGSLSGPIPLPRWLGGKDSTFFAITEEGYRQRSPYVNNTQFVVPTEKERLGNFSEIGTVGPGGNCVSGTCIVNLAASTPTNKVYYPGNIITNINPVGQSILNYYPHPNTSATAVGAVNFNGYDVLGDRADEFNGKISHKFSERWTAGFYYLHYGSKEPGGNPLQIVSGGDRSVLLFRKVDAIGITNTIVVNPSTVATVGYGFNRFPNNATDLSAGFDQSGLGFPSSYLAAQSKRSFPRITTDSTLTNLGTSYAGPSVFFSRNFVAGVAKSLGRHSIKTGYNFRSISLTFTDLSDTAGFFNFNSLSGHAAADMLQGIPTTGQLIIPTKLAYTTSYQAIYLHDDWRMTPKLTVNAGLRFEYEHGIHERNDEIAVGFDRSSTYTPAGSSAQAKGGVMFANQNGNGRNTGDMGSKWSPRLGFAYAVDKDTVVKGGFGMFYAPHYYTTTSTYAPGYVLTNSIATQSLGNSPITLSNPYPILQTAATGNRNGLATNIGTTLSLIDQYRRSPLYQSYSLEVERQLWWGIAIKAGYIGGHGRNLPNSLNINQLADGNYALGASSLTTAVANPYAGIGSFGSGTVQRYQTLRPFPQYQNITMATSLGRSRYNALNVKVQKQMSRGVTVLVGYTWSSNWDNIWGAYGSANALNTGNNGPQDIYNLKSEYARATNNTPNRFTLAGTWELPFGRGRAFLNQNRWLDLLVGGWNFNDVTILQNGSPLAIVQTNNITSYGNSTQRPSLIAGMNPCKSGRPQDRLGQYFNPQAFSITPPPSVGGSLPFGTAPRAVGCQGPGYANFDLSLNKQFHLKEGIKAEFRAEALNAFNTPQFSTPNLTVGSWNSSTNSAVYNSGAGQVTGTLGFPRLIQLGGRVTF